MLIYTSYRVLNKSIREIMVTLAALFIVFQSSGQGKSGTVGNNSTSAHASFGMRLRKLPEKITGIYKPVRLQRSFPSGLSCVRLSGDTLKVFFVEKPDKMMSVASFDGGRNWGKSKEEFELPGLRIAGNQCIKSANGELLCVFAVWGKGEGGYRGRLLNLWYCHTDGGGKHWTTPREIFHGYVGALRSFIQLKSGRLLLAFAKAVPEREKAPPKGITDYGWNDIISLYSDDEGKTWKPSENSLKIVSQRSKTTRYGGIEPAIVELKSGKIWMLIRTNSGYLYESYSDDGGKSWEEPKATEFISSNSPAAILRLSDNRIIIFWCSDQCWDNPRSYADGGRGILHAAISDDGGKTWKGFREVLTKPVEDLPKHGDFGTAYSSAIETTDNKVVLASGQGAGRAIVLFDPDWLEDSFAMDDFSNRLVQWTMFDGDSATCLSTLPGEKNREALLVRKSENKKYLNTEAEWNFPMMSQGEMILKVRKNSGSKGINLALTDHFSTCGDTLANEHAVFTFSLDGKKNVWRDAKEDIEIKIQWDIRKERAKLYLNRKLASTAKMQRRPYFGVNYLRIGIPDNAEDMAGYYVRSVRVREK